MDENPNLEPVVLPCLYVSPPPKKKRTGIEEIARPVFTWHKKRRTTRKTSSYQSRGERRKVRFSYDKKKTYRQKNKTAAVSRRTQVRPVLVRYATKKIPQKTKPHRCRGERRSGRPERRRPQRCGSFPKTRPVDRRPSRRRRHHDLRCHRDPADLCCSAQNTFGSMLGRGPSGAKEEKGGARKERGAGGSEKSIRKRSRRVFTIHTASGVFATN